MKERQTVAYLSQQPFQVAFNTLSACQNHLIIFIDASQNTACCAHNAFSFPQQLAFRYTSARPTLISQTETESLRGGVITTHPPVGVWGENLATETESLRGGVITSPQDPSTGGRVRRKPGRRSARGTHLSGCYCCSSSSGLKGTLSPGCVCLGPQCAARDELQGGRVRVGPFSSVAPGCGGGARH